MASNPKGVRCNTLFAIAVVASLTMAPTAWSAISWDGGGMSNWWFDYTNWGAESGGGCPCLPPAQDEGETGVRASDAQINIGSGDWDVTGEGVVFDPDNDPNFAAAASLNYPTGSGYAGEPYNMEYGPQSIYRLYISRNTTAHNKLTIKSGELWIDSTTIIGRSGSTAEEQNEGRVVQTGGALMMPLSTLDIGNSETSGWGNGVYEYRGGTMEISIDGGNGIRLGHGRSGTGPSGVNLFVVDNPDTPGHVRTWDFNMISYRGSADGVFTEGEDPNGVDRGVATVEFHYDNGGTRPVQVARNLTINNGLEASTGGILSSRLDFVLDEAPTVDGSGVPNDLGLFDVNFDLGFGDNGGVINGNGDIVDQFATADGTSHYAQGDTVSAVFGNTRYDWTISYTGNITWSNADDSIVDTISDTGGSDVVLMGLGSEALPGLLGDFNNDGIVNIGDYTVWRNNLGAPDSVLPDGSTDDGSGTVDAGDYATWKNNFGNAAAAVGGLEAVSVPEPGSCILLGLIGLSAVAYMRRR